MVLIWKQEKQLKLIMALYITLSHSFSASQVALVEKNLPANARDETWVHSLGWEEPMEKIMETHSSILAWKSHGQRSLVG